MIRIEQLGKSYEDVAALRGIDLTIRKGAVTGLLGPNGAGKTTLVSILTGIIKKDAGTVLVNGLDLDRDLPGIKTISSIVPQSIALYPSLTVRENLEYFGVMYGSRGAALRGRIDFAVEVASLQPFLAKRAGRASGGIQRRLNLAIGLLNDPEVLYLDEPTVGVDAQSRKYMLEMIRQINRERGTTIIYTSHYISEIQQISDDIVIIDNGSIVLNDTMGNILSASGTIALHVTPHGENSFEGLPALPGLTLEGCVFYLERNDDFYESLTALLAFLKKRGMGLDNMQFSANRLEDIYLNLTSRRLRDEE